MVAFPSILLEAPAVEVAVLQSRISISKARLALDCCCVVGRMGSVDSEYADAGFRYLLLVFLLLYCWS